ncbi:MAG: S8 family serine peptidase, partial [candidate division KSB1 bacterium]|nr:S8 family serine peptidase [candidate division KSB1 bacterium]
MTTIIRFGMALLTLLCLVLTEINGQPFPKAKMIEKQLMEITDSDSMPHQIPNLASSLEQLYHYQIARHDIHSFATSNRLQLIGENVLVTILPYHNFTTKDINERYISQVGATIQARAQHSLRAEVPIAQLANLAKALRGLAEIHNVIRPVADAITSEGVTLMNADNWHVSGQTGVGARVAIIDGGFYKLTDAQNNGDIPPTYYALDLTGRGMQASSDGEHGTAVTEAVYDVAPGASFYLYKIDDLTDLENAKDDAINQGVHIVNHSMSWFGLSYYDGTGGACEAAADAIAHGITWVNSAGNHAKDHYRGVFVPTVDNFHDFTGAGDKLDPLGPEPGYVWLFPLGTIIQVWMNWDSYPTTSEDYDLYLYKWNYSNSTWQVATSSTNRQSNSSPTETVAYLNLTKDGRYAIAVKKYSASTNVDFTIFASYGLSYHVVESSVTDPGSYSDVVTVGAISKNFYESGPQEYFSGQGPTTDGRPKPDVAAPDSCNSFAYGYWQGTSLSSPHTAGICALIKGRFPTFGEVDVRNYLYENCVIDLGDPGRDNVYGLGKVVLPDFEYLRLTSPNGGEDWAVGSIHDITWNSSGTSGAVKIDYSSDNGSNWIGITASTPDAGSYPWIIPDNASGNCLVRVSDADGSPTDQSDRAFTITLLRITDLRASVQGQSILLEWSEVTGAAGYNIYRGLSFNFDPDEIGGSNRIGNQVVDEDPTIAGIQWTDNGNGADVVGDVNNNFCYRVTAWVPSQSFETAPSNLAIEFDYPLFATAGTDINEIAVVANTQNTRLPITTAEELAQAIPNCTDVYYWDAAGQGTTGHPKGLPFNNFSIIPGYPYIVNVVADTIWTVAGSYEMPVFNLITTNGTDINHLAVPLEKGGQTTAEALGQDIPNCTDVYVWDAAAQGTMGHVVGLPFGDFAVRAGYPYYVNVTAPTSWPSGGSALMKQQPHLP